MKLNGFVSKYEIFKDTFREDKPVKIELKGGRMNIPEKGLNN